MKLKLSEVSRKKELQVRLNGVNPFVIEEYQLALEEGAEFPPLVVFQLPDNTKVLVDGFHRFLAYRNCGVEEAEVEVQEGTYEEALDYTRFESNRTNGQRLTRSDLWAVLEAVVVDPRYYQLSDRELAKLCKCTHPSVAAARLRVGVTPDSKLGQDGKVRRTRDWEPTVPLNEGSPPEGPEGPEDGGWGALGALLVQRLKDHTTDLATSAEKLEEVAAQGALSTEAAAELDEATERLLEVCSRLCGLVPLDQGGKAP